MTWIITTSGDRKGSCFHAFVSIDVDISVTAQDLGFSLMKCVEGYNTW